MTINKDDTNATPEFRAVADMSRGELVDDYGRIAAMVKPFNDRLEILKDRIKVQTNGSGDIDGQKYHAKVFQQDFYAIDKEKLMMILQIVRINGKKINDVEKYIDDNLRTNHPRTVCKVNALSAQKKTKKTV